MKTITLHRIKALQSEYATFGVLSDDGRPFAVTLEPPWKGNKRGVSCIYAGMYDCKKYKSPKTGKTVWMLQGVPGRDGVEIHTGTFNKDTRGCVILGESFENMTYKGYTGDGVAQSSKAMFELMARVKNADCFRLNIVEAV